MMSLQEQLKKSGLVDDKKAKQLQRAKIKEEKIARKNAGKSPNPKAQQLDLERAAQAEKDRLLNQEKNAAANLSALKSQIKQLIESNGISPDGDKKFGYVVEGKIKQIWLSQQQIDKLSHGELCLVQCSGPVTLVLKQVAEKIAQRYPSALLHKAENTSAKSDDDSYAQYKIPDDLDW